VPFIATIVIGLFFFELLGLPGFLKFFVASANSSSFQHFSFEQSNFLQHNSILLLIQW
jgi:hypothetical protein